MLSIFKKLQNFHVSSSVILTLAIIMTRADLSPVLQSTVYPPLLPTSFTDIST